MVPRTLPYDGTGGRTIRRLFRLCAWGWVSLSGVAHARGTISGWGVPQYGGAFAGAGEPGVHGMPFNPASASVTGVELGAEVTGFFTQYSSQLEGAAERSDDGFRAAPFLALAAEVPRLDWVGIGASLGAPFVRAAEGVPPQSPRRFHGLRGSLMIVELDAVVAVEPWDGVEVGAGVVHQWLSAESKAALNTGALMVELFGDDMAPLVEEPLFEGTVEVKDASGRGRAGTVGARITAIDGWTLAAAYRTESRIPMKAGLELIPSNSFNLSLESGVEGELVTPPEIHLMVARGGGPVRVALEGQWIGWSRTASSEFDLVAPELGSPDATMEAILVGYGLTDLSLLGHTQTDRNVGYEDTRGGGIRLDYEAGRAVWMARSFYSTHATPDGWVHPGNLDFASLDNRLGVRVRAGGGLELGLSAAWYYFPERVVTSSKASFTTDPDDGPVLPSGNGEYRLKLHTAGLSAVYRFQ